MRKTNKFLIEQMIMELQALKDLDKVVKDIINIHGIDIYNAELIDRLTRRQAIYQCFTLSADEYIDFLNRMSDLIDHYESEVRKAS